MKDFCREFLFKTLIKPIHGRRRLTHPCEAPNPDEDEGGRTEDEGGRGLAASKAEASSGKASSDGEGPVAWLRGKHGHSLVG